jgi:transposase
VPAKKHIVDLTDEERAHLLDFINKGRPSARKVTRARILLKADEGLKDEAIVNALNTSRPTVERIRKRFVEGGLGKALNEDRRRTYRRKLEGREEAHLIALACSEAPAGHARWSLRMLADKLVALGVVATVSHETVRQTLKKTHSNPGCEHSGASPAQ